MLNQVQHDRRCHSGPDPESLWRDAESGVQHDKYLLDSPFLLIKVKITDPNQKCPDRQGLHPS